MDQVNWGPLTVTFTPPTSCLSTLTLGTDPTPFLFQGHWGIANLDISCFPPATIPSSQLYQTVAWNAYLYSPGIVCPSGYTTAQTFQKAIPEYQSRLSIDTDTSAALCCPSLYDYFGNDGHACAFTANPGFVATYYDIASSLRTTTLVSAMTISGNGIPLVWQSTDLKAVSTSTSSNTGIVTSRSTSNFIAPTTGPTITASSPTVIPSNASTPNNGLSTGAAVGLGVGVTLVAISIILLGVALWYIRRLKAKNKTTSGQTRPEGEETSAEVFEAAQPTVEILTEPESYHNRHELPSRFEKPQELP